MKYQTFGEDSTFVEQSFSKNVYLIKEFFSKKVLKFLRASHSLGLFTPFKDPEI